MQAIHRHLLGSIFEWAGQLRTVEMAKGDTRFANADFIEQAANSLFEELHSENLLDGLSDEKYNIRLAHYYSEVNILYPFREGNGRTQRAFFTLLAARSGRSIMWDKMNLDDNLAASIKAYKGDESGLVVLLNSLIVKNQY